MRSVYPALAALLLLPAAAALSACGDSFGVETVLRSDSLVLASANGPSTLPSALDIANGVLSTRPELPAQAGLFDLQVRQSGNVFTLVPSPATGSLRGAGLQLTTRDIANPGNAPREVDTYTRTAQTIAVGQTYFVQTRPVCGTASKYGMLKVLALKADSGLVTLKVVSNQGCDDERLED
ncbi:MAG TPA: hypothetical protein VEX86_10570 [Longimicrobium sp.]|nr:hypothetical protein [Longimicrobium sp.]